MTSITISQNTAIQSNTQLTIEHVPPESYPALRKVVLAWQTFASIQQQASFESLSKMLLSSSSADTTLVCEKMQKNIYLFMDSEVACKLMADSLAEQESRLVYQCVDASSQSVEGVIVLKYDSEENPDTLLVEYLASNPKNLPPSPIDTTQTKVRGVGARLLQHAEKAFIQKKASLSGSEQILVSAFKGVCEFYERQGFSKDPNGVGTTVQRMYKKITDAPSSTFLKAASE